MNERSSSIVGLLAKKQVYTFNATVLRDGMVQKKKTKQNLLLTNYLFLIVKCQLLSASRCNHTWIRRQNVKSCRPPEALHINFEEEMRRDGEKIVSNEHNGVIFFFPLQKSETRAAGRLATQSCSPLSMRISRTFDFLVWKLNVFSSAFSAAGFSQ